MLDLVNAQYNNNLAAILNFKVVDTMLWGGGGGGGGRVVPFYAFGWCLKNTNAAGFELGNTNVAQYFRI